MVDVTSNKSFLRRSPEGSEIAHLRGQVKCLEEEHSKVEAELRHEISNFAARSLDYVSVGDITSSRVCEDAAYALRRVLGVLEE